MQYDNGLHNKFCPNTRVKPLDDLQSCHHRAAGVGIETIRYYQRRNLLPKPEPEGAAFRHYPPALVDRIDFIKRAQELGFSLDEISLCSNSRMGCTSARYVRLQANT